MVVRTIASNKIAKSNMKRRKRENSWILFNFEQIFLFYWWKRTTGIRFLIFLSRKQSSTSITKYCNQKNSQIQHESVENARNHRFCSILSKYFALLMKKTNNNIKFSDFFSCKQSTTSSPSIAPKRICKIPPPKQKIWAIEIFPLARRAKGKKRAWVARYGLLEWRDLLQVRKTQMLPQKFPFHRRPYCAPF